MRRPRHERNGFTLITLILMLALATISAGVVLSSIGDEQALLRGERQIAEAREIAEGGLMEVLNDQGLAEVLPTMETPGLHADYAPSSASVFANPSLVRSHGEYDADIDLVRVAPMLESSHTTVRAVMYQVRVRAEAADGTSAGVEAEVYKVTSSSSGIIQPRAHAR